MMRRNLLAVATMIAGLTAMPASAQLLSDNFDSENGGASYLNYGTAGGTSFTNFNVTQGSVDLVKSGEYGITCVGGSGSCIDLEGTSPGALNGQLKSKQTYAFAIGDVVSLSFLLSGNQRPDLDPNGDHFMIAFYFPGTDAQHLVVLNNLTIVDGALTYVTPTVTTAIDFGYGSGTIAATDPFALRSISFTAGTAGSLAFSIQGDDLSPFGFQPNDQYGPIIDNVQFSVGRAVTSGVPEPATWAMMTLGFGAIGAGMRRRRVGRARYA